MADELRTAFALLMFIVFVFVLAIYELFDLLLGKEPPYTLREILGLDKSVDDWQ